MPRHCSQQCIVLSSPIGDRGKQYDVDFEESCCHFQKRANTAQNYRQPRTNRTVITGNAVFLVKISPCFDFSARIVSIATPAAQGPKRSTAQLYLSYLAGILSVVIVNFTT